MFFTAFSIFQNNILIFSPLYIFSENIFGGNLRLLCEKLGILSLYYRLCDEFVKQFFQIEIIDYS